MKRIIFSIYCLLTLATANAQDFIQTGKIEFEKKVSFRKMMAEFERQFEKPKGATIVMGDYQAPEFQISKTQLLFSGNKTVYKPIEEGNQHSMMFGWGGGSGITIYTDLDKKTAVFNSEIGMEDIIFQDSLRHVRWKIEDETRKIAGWKCRKAVGVIMDSVYVVVFYCPEIIPQGGPEFVTGLPGMVLGLAIPRMYTTWFATKVQVSGVEEKNVQMPALGKKEKLMSMEEARKNWRNSIGSIVRKEIADEQIDYSLKGVGSNMMFR